MTINRRDFVKALGATAAVSAVGFPFIAGAAGKARVVVVGGGYAGATCAKYIRKYNSGIDVIVDEGIEIVDTPEGPRWRRKERA